VRVWRLPPAGPSTAGRDDQVTAVALSPDGRTTALGTRDGSLRLQLAGEGAAISRPPAEAGVNYFGHTRAVCCAAFSPDGSLLASAAVDGSLRVWDARAGEPREFIALQPAAHPVEALAVSGDGERVAVVAGPHLQVWDASEGRLLSQRQPGARVTALQSLPGGEGFVLGDASGSLWQLGRTDRLERLAGVGSAVTALALTRNGNVLAVATAAGALQLLDMADRQLKGAADPLPVPATALAFSRDGDHLVARSGHWLHRYRRSVFQLLPASSRLLPATVIRGGMSLTGAHGDRVRVLAGYGTPRPVSLSLGAVDVPPLQGESQLLVEQWRDRLRAGAALLSEPARAGRGQPAPAPER